MIDTKNTFSGLFVEIVKRKAVSTLAVSGILAVEDLSSENIVLKTHSGRIKISGKSLVLSVFEGRTVEVSGKIAGVEF